MDALSDVLRAMRLCGAVFFTADFTAPWALASPNPTLLGPVVLPTADQLSLFHILIEGECVVECDGRAPVMLASGDVVVFPHGHAHTMRSDPGATATPLDHVLSRPSADSLLHIAYGGGGRAARFICGYLDCNLRFAPMFGALPPILLVRRADDYGLVETAPRGDQNTPCVPHESGKWLTTTVDFTISEAAGGRPGNHAMLGRLAELMFVEIVREYMQQLPEDHQGWLAALNDPQVGRALRLIHADPVRRWTVESLAREVALSRSALAERFARFIGMSPMKYLARWRMQLAKELLRAPGDTIQGVAARVGYKSEPAFNRAFKRVTGSPPATWRRDAVNPQTAT